MATLTAVEKFIIARIKELARLGWTPKQIAEALGVDIDFVRDILFNK